MQEAQPVVQTPGAPRCDEDTTSHQSPVVVQTPGAPRCDEDTTSHQSPSKRKTHSLHSEAKQDNSSFQTPPSCRTRSQAAPDWTVQEVLVLLSEIAAIDEEWFQDLSSYQRWKMISESCIALNVVRSSNQCKRKWEMLLDDYVKIRKWESRSKDDSYWVLLAERRKDHGLPLSFQKEVFDAIDAVIQVQQHESDSCNSDPDRIISVSEFEASNMDTDSETSVQLLPPTFHEDEVLITTSKSPEVEGLIRTSNSPEERPEVERLITSSKCPDERPDVEEMITTSRSLEVEDLTRISKSSEAEELITTLKSPEKAGVIAGNLQEKAGHVCAILRRELHDGASRGSLPLNSLKPSVTETEFARRQADDLIKALAGLTNTLDELCEYINTKGCSRIVPMDSKA